MIFSKRQKKIGISLSVIVLVAFLFGSVNSIVTLWKSVYILEGQSLGAYNSVQLDILEALERSYKSVFQSPKTNVDQVRLYVSEKNQNHLTSSLPYSAKDWVQGLILDLDSGKLKKISVKHRGDNPNNWLHGKKSWRVKRKKSDLKDGQRVFNYSLPRDTALINTYLGYFIAERMNIIVPKYRFVELYINDKYEGLYLETQHIDENFLRMNQSMPVNIYKGTPSRTDKPLNLDSDLFNNPYLWEKSATFNAKLESDYGDLEEFLILIRSSVNDTKKMKQLEKIANIDKWATFSAYETIMQSWHNYEKNNMYLISDPWLGEIYPIAYDTIFNDTKSSPIVEEPFKIDNASHALTEVYSNNSRFLDAKSTILNSLIKRDFYSEISQEAIRVYALIKKSWEADPSHVQFSLTNEFDKNLIFNSGMDKEFEKLLKRIDFIESELKSSLSYPNAFNWGFSDNNLDLIVMSNIPTQKIKICSEEPNLPEKIMLTEQGRYNFNSMVGLDGCYVFGVTLNSNRVRPQLNRSRITAFSAATGFEIKPTIFSFKIDKSINISEVSVMFSGASEFKRAIDNVKIKKNSRSLNNTPINQLIQKPRLTWQGEIYINDLKIIDQPITIMPGTIIKLGPSGTVIFKDKVQSRGTKDQKVKFLRSGNQPWGVIALVGEGTRGSTFEHTNLSGGSGGAFDGYVFTGMFSIYATSEIKMSYLNVSNNVLYDDLVHILYSDQIELTDSTLFDAMSDAIDIDLSVVEINNSTFVNSGNDAIDSMTSQVKIKNTKIIKAGDKGLSAGESSNVDVFNVSFDETEIGIQSKDNTTVFVSNSLFKNNKKQLDAYQKNWRYGNGGYIKIQDSIFEGDKNIIKAKDNSQISIIDSLFNDNYEHMRTKKVVFKNNYLIKKN